ncbi:MAG: hypothetical protein ABIJ27_03650 [Candidatus Omnitrophota bacterium]
MDIEIRTPSKLIFQGKAESVILPGEVGVFEVLPFHKRLLARLVKGSVNVDGKLFAIRRGVVKVDRETVIVIGEE